MEVKTITETAKSFEVLLVGKGKEKKVYLTQRKGADWVMRYEDGTEPEQSVKDFLVDTINGYMSTGKIPEGRKEAEYTTNEVRYWICPLCDGPNTTERVAQGYPLPLCQFCEEQSDWGEKGD